MKMRRIDYLLNAKDPIKVLVEEFDLALDCCECQYDGECDGMNVNCNGGFIKYLWEDIEVNKSDLKTVEIKEKTNTKETLQETLDKVKEPVENDPVNHPSYYTDTKIEVMDYIEDKGFNFALGNAVKYISRAGKKDPNKTIQDLEKANWYLNREIERLKKENEHDR